MEPMCLDLCNVQLQTPQKVLSKSFIPFSSLLFSSLLSPPLPKKGSFMQPNWFEATLLFEAHHLSTCLIKKIATQNNRIVQWLGRGCSSLRYSSSEIQKLIMQAGPMIMQLGWPAGHPSIDLKLGALLTKNILCCSMTSTLLIVRKAWQKKGVLGPQGPPPKKKKNLMGWVVHFGHQSFALHTILWQYLPLRKIYLNCSLYKVSNLGLINKKKKKNQKKKNKRKQALLIESMANIDKLNYFCAKLA